MPCSSIPEDVWELLLIHVKLSKDQSFYIFECGKRLLKKVWERVRSVWDHRTMPWSLMVIWGISFNLFWGRLALFSHLWNENWTFLMSRVGWWVIHIKTPWGLFLSHTVFEGLWCSTLDSGIPSCVKLKGKKRPGDPVVFDFLSFFLNLEIEEIHFGFEMHCSQQIWPFYRTHSSLFCLLSPTSCVLIFHRL